MLESQRRSQPHGVGGLRRPPRILRSLQKARMLAWAAHGPVVSQPSLGSGAVPHAESGEGPRTRLARYGARSSC